MTITRVASQGGGVTVDASSTCARAFPGNVTSGNLVYFAAARDDNSTGAAAWTFSSLAKSAGTATIGTVSLDKTLQVGNSTVAIWSALVTGTGSLTLTATSSSACYYCAGSDELASDVGWSASRLEDSSTGSGTSASQLTGNVTSAGAACFVGVTSFIASGVQVINPEAAYTLLYKELDGNSHEPGITFFKIVSSGNTDAIESGSTNSNLYTIAGAVFKEGGVVAGPTLTLMTMGVG